MRAIAYLRVSTDEQGHSGLGLEAQTETITRACEQRGLDLCQTYVDVASGKTRAHRPQLAAALEAVGTGEAEVLVVAKLDRLARSVLDFCTIAAQADKEHWNLLILDPLVDFTDPAGRLLAHVMAAFAEWERAIIAKRTSEALQAAKRRGARLGREVMVPVDVAAWIVRERDGGASYTAIANDLNDRRIPTAHGGAKWHASTVRAVEQRVRTDVSASA
jgi:DNA invertase Pin-like site-specific DNA recombinase